MNAYFPNFKTIIFIFRALAAGIKRPLLSLLPVSNNPLYKHGNLVSVLGALQALYVVSKHFFFIYFSYFRF